jgi:hypothetical protein
MKSHIFIVLMICTRLVSASNIELSTSGSGSNFNSNRLSFSYSQKPDIADEKDSPWSINGSISRNTATSGITVGEQINTSAYTGGVSYLTDNDFEFALDYEIEKTENDGVQLSKPSVLIGKKIDLRNLFSDGETDLAASTLFHEKIGLSFGYEKLSAVQKALNKLGQDSIATGNKISSGISIELIRWLEVDFNYSKLSYEEDLQNLYARATSAPYLVGRGSSFASMLNSLNDQELSARLVINFTDLTYLDLDYITSKSIIEPAWYRSYSVKLTSVIFDTWKYSIGGTDSSSPGQKSISGELSLAYLF